MKRCQNCNFQNEGLLDYCWECGSRSIIWGTSQNVPQSVQPTQIYRSETPTYFNHNQQGFNQNYNTNGYNYTTNNVNPTQPKGGRKVMLVVAAVFTFLLLFSAVGAATYYRIVVSPKRVEVTRTEQPVTESEIVKQEEKTETTNKTESVNKTNSTTRTNSTNRTNTSTRTNTSNNSRSVGNTSTTRRNNSVRKNNGRETAELHRMWVDYNVRENGELGMRVHVSFTTYNMKDMPGYLGIYFSKENGTRLTTKNKSYASADGQVAIYYYITPGWEETVYEDVELFIPYDEFNLGRGKFNLTMSADVIYEKGGLIKHLKDYDFIYEEK